MKTRIYAAPAVKGLSKVHCFHSMVCLHDRIFPHSKAMLLRVRRPCRLGEAQPCCREDGTTVCYIIF